ncbi:MAG: hypothetical protein PHS06_01455 [Candidatus Shapirobacteria bacterium]|nr:hypothetical protein [Candidatus Shapirobacteria bacterium]
MKTEFVLDLDIIFNIQFECKLEIKENKIERRIKMDFKAIAIIGSEEISGKIIINDIEETGNGWLRLMNAGRFYFKKGKVILPAKEYDVWIDENTKIGNITFTNGADGNNPIEIVLHKDTIIEFDKFSLVNPDNSHEHSIILIKKGTQVVITDFLSHFVFIPDKLPFKTEDVTCFVFII